MWHWSYPLSPLDFTCVHMCKFMQTHAQLLCPHIMWGQSWAGPVVCHLEAIRGEPAQVKSYQSSDERQAGLMRLYAAPGKWILHTRNTKSCLPSSSMTAPKPQLWRHRDSVSLQQQKQSKKITVCMRVHVHGQNRLLKPLRQGGIWKSNCQYKHLESIGHIKEKRETGGGRAWTEGIRE